MYLTNPERETDPANYETELIWPVSGG